MTSWMRGRLKSLTPTRLVRCALKPVTVFIVILMMLSLTGCEGNLTGILNPKGFIALKERKLLFDTLALMLIVVLPVIVMSLTFVYHYQASHKIRDYKPNWSHSYFLETIWWGIPCVIIFILAVMTWKSSHELDPYKRIDGYTGKPMLIQAIALPWKWLFIYPEQGIATVNYLEVPVNRQVEYWITADNAVMSAFFIPQLGSQIYAMAGMRTRLHLVGNKLGTFKGLDTQYNGPGFSDMHFPVHVVTESEMKQWIAKTKRSSNRLTQAAYNQLVEPTKKDKPKFYSSVKKDLFNDVIKLYTTAFGPKHPRGANGNWIKE